MPFRIHRPKIEVKELKVEALTVVLPNGSKVTIEPGKHAYFSYWCVGNPSDLGTPWFFELKGNGITVAEIIEYTLDKKEKSNE